MKYITTGVSDGVKYWGTATGRIKMHPFSFFFTLLGGECGMAVLLWRGTPLNPGKNRHDPRSWHCIWFPVHTCFRNFSPGSLVILLYLNLGFLNKSIFGIIYIWCYSTSADWELIWCPQNAFTTLNNYWGGQGHPCRPASYTHLLQLGLKWLNYKMYKSN